jgi:predicted nucleotidyltransferase
MTVHAPPALHRSLPPVIASKSKELARICRQFCVRRLELFGSAASGAHGRPGDLDFVVDLGDLPPREYADAYFRLREGLEALFGLPVDLVTPANLSNPHFRQRVEQEKILLYAA